MQVWWFGCIAWAIYLRCLLPDCCTGGILASCAAGMQSCICFWQSDSRALPGPRGGSLSVLGAGHRHLACSAGI